MGKAKAKNTRKRDKAATATGESHAVRRRIFERAKEHLVVGVHPSFAVRLLKRPLKSRTLKRQGRPKYDRAFYKDIAEARIKEGVDPTKKAFFIRYRGWLREQNKKLEPQHRKHVPGNDFLKKEIGPIYDREKAKQ